MMMPAPLGRVDLVALTKTKAAPKILLGSGSSRGFERDLMAETFEALDVITGEALRFESVEEVAAQVGVRGS